MDNPPALEDSMDPQALLETIAADITARFPEASSRIAAAVKLVQYGHVTPPTTGTVWAVAATHHPVAYHATAHTCSCPDAQLRERRCKHQYAVVLYGALEDEIRHRALCAGAPIPYEPTTKGYAVAVARPLMRRLVRQARAARLAQYQLESNQRPPAQQEG